MKQYIKYFTFLVVLMSVAAFSACNDDDNTNTNEASFMVSPDGLSFLWGGGSQYVSLYGNDVTVNPDAGENAWITFSDITSSGFYVIVSENTEEARSGEVDLGDNVKLTVSQDGLVSIVIDQDHLEFEVVSEGERIVNVNTKNVSSLTIEKDEWITAAYEDGMLFVDVIENITGYKRTGTIKLSSPEYKDERIVITVVQDRNSLYFDGTYEAACSRREVFYTYDVHGIAYPETFSNTVVTDLNIESEGRRYDMYSFLDFGNYPGDYFYIGYDIEANTYILYPQIAYMNSNTGTEVAYFITMSFYSADGIMYAPFQEIKWNYETNSFELGKQIYGYDAFVCMCAFTLASGFTQPASDGYYDLNILMP